MLMRTKALEWRFRKGQVRTVIALGVVVAAYFLQDTILTGPYHQTRTWLGISPPPPNTLLCSAFGILVSFRLLWWLAITGLVAFLDPPGIAPVLRLHKLQVVYFLKGLTVGFAVMAATVLMIVAVGDAQLRSSPGSAAVHVAYGLAWLSGEIMGAAGEELLFRGLILVLTTRLFGMRIAILISALAFSLAHGANPGASIIWMLRLAVAGMLLAYSVFRSGTILWGIGYHAGWNFASAPLFGAAGSGYIDQGHIFSFLPSGSAVITGGPVGPEGSAFAFAAVVVGILFLLWTVPPNEDRRYLEG
jgi:uncharacterized protein